MLSLGWAGAVSAAANLVQTSPAPAADTAVQPWLERLQSAPQRFRYSGVVAVTIQGRSTTSLLDHGRTAEGQWVDRIETLGGPSRITYRQADEVLTLWPAQREAVREKRDPLLTFPRLLQGPASRLDPYYRIQVAPSEAQVAGHRARKLDFLPRDSYRYRYRVWSEIGSGLPLRVQTLNGEGRVLEQAAFTDLNIQPLDKHAGEASVTLTPDLQGYRILLSSLESTDARREGWQLSQPVPGFEAMNCYRRQLGPAQAEPAMQWIFSDGLSTVSLFLQPYDAQHGRRELQLKQGATQILTRRLGDWWLTAVGEVPPATLQAFAERLQRLR